MMKYFFALLCLLSFVLSSRAQNETYDVVEADSASVNTVENDTLYHSPRKATIMSALVPGLGQVYNKKYWKLPIIYAGMGTCIYFISENGISYRRYRDALIAARDDDPSTVNDTGFTPNQLDQLQDTYRRWLDLSWMSLAGVYILQIIDANVDAHLFYFDVSEDLTLNWTPRFDLSPTGSAGLSFTLNF